MADIEKVKQGLKICTDESWVGNCEIDGKHCPYEEDHIISCFAIMCRDALSVIESLQSENKILSENCDGLSKQRDDFAQTIHEQKMEIERLGEIAARDCDICVNKMLKDERRWIPVSERLPELYTTVLVAVYGKRVTYCQVWLFGKEKGWTLEGVTHWMPLPQPPKEGEHGG